MENPYDKFKDFELWEFKEGLIEIEKFQKEREKTAKFVQKKEYFYPEIDYRFYFYLSLKKVGDFYLKMIDHQFMAKHFFKQCAKAFLNEEWDVTLKELCERARFQGGGTIFGWSFHEPMKVITRFRREMKYVGIDKETQKKIMFKLKPDLEKIPDL